MAYSPRKWWKRANTTAKALTMEDMQAAYDACVTTQSYTTISVDATTAADTKSFTTATPALTSQALLSSTAAAMKQQLLAGIVTKEQVMKDLMNQTMYADDDLSPKPEKKKKEEPKQKYPSMPEPF